MRILIVAGDMNMGGIENQLMHLIRNADKEVFHFDYTTTIQDPYFKSEIESRGGQCVKIRPTNGWHLFRYARSLYRVIKEGKYDVVHSHELFHSGLVLLVAKMAGVKVRVVHAHNWAEGDSIKANSSAIRKIYNAAMRQLILRNATDYCACSSLAGKFLYGNDIENCKNYHLIYNSVDTQKFLDRYNDLESGEFCDDWVNVLQVGRFTVVKNQLFTAQIAQEMKKRGHRIRFLCAGNDDGEYEQSVRKYIRDNQLEDYIKLVGIRSDIDSLMRKSNAFILPSQYEGMPLVLIEAQASGLPCVIADTFSHEVDYNIGLINWKPLGDGVESWADAIEVAVRHSRAKKELVINAIDRYGFDSKSFADKLCQIYLKSYEEKNKDTLLH